MADIYHVSGKLDDQLVRWAEELVVQRAGKLSKKDAAKSQIQKAIETAAKAGSPRVFANWLRYQWSRESSGDLWGITEDNGGKKALAQAILEVIDKIKNETGEKSLFEEERNKRVMYLAARFLGYLKRSVVAADKLKGLPGMK